MKRFLFMVLMLISVFTLAACNGDPNYSDELNDILDEVLDNQAMLESLQTEIAATKAMIDDLESMLEELEEMLDEMQSELELLATHEHIQELEGELEAAHTKLNTLLAELALVVGMLESLQEQTTTITIAHTNDIHGRVEYGPFDGMGLARVKRVVDVLKAYNPNTLLVDAGDAFHGTNFVTIDQGKSMVDVMNMVGYDLMVPGNHDFNYGYERLLELRDYADFHMISANVYDEDDHYLFNPYIIMDIDGVKVAFFGLTTPETVYKTHPNNVEGLTFASPIDEAQAMVDHLEGKADVIVALAHIGIDEDTEITTHDIAAEVDGIHLIIDGHSHSAPGTSTTINNTLIVSALEYTKVVGVVHITVTNGEVVSMESTYVSTQQAMLYGEDRHVAEYIAELKALQEEILSEVVANTAYRINGERELVRTQETNSGNLITDAMLYETGADIAITNGGGIRASFEVGDITLGDVFNMLPFGNYIITKELTGAQIVDILNTVTSGFTGSNQIGSFPHVAGISYTIDLNLEENRIIDVMVNGDPIDLEATYIVATNDFLAAGGDNYPHFMNADTINEYGTLAEVLINYMLTLENDFSDYEDVEGRITIIQPLPNIPETAIAADDFDILVAALIEAELVSALEAEGPFTVFAPTDQAFEDLMAALEITLEDLLELENLADILLYHVVAGKFNAEDVIALTAEGPVMVETLSGAEIELSVVEGNVYVNGILVIIADIEASNGVIHVIEGVLIPEETLLNIPETAIAADDFDILVAALIEAELVSALEAEGPFTVFAPTDQAFEDLMAALEITLEDLLELENLADILLYHVVAGSYSAADLIDLATDDPYELETLLGDMLIITVDDGKVFVNGIEVILADIEASNGMIHVIEGVLIPEEEPNS